MSLKRLLWFGVLAFGLFFLVESPVEAARLVKVTGEGAGEWLAEVAESMSKFVKNLV